MSFGVPGGVQEASGKALGYLGRVLGCPEGLWIAGGVYGGLGKASGCCEGHLEVFMGILEEPGVFWRSFGGP